MVVGVALFAVVPILLCRHMHTYFMNLISNFNQYLKKCKEIITLLINEETNLYSGAPYILWVLVGRGALMTGPWVLPQCHHISWSLPPSAHYKQDHPNRRQPTTNNAFPTAASLPQTTLPNRRQPTTNNAFPTAASPLQTTPP